MLCQAQGAQYAQVSYVSWFASYLLGESFRGSILLFLNEWERLANLLGKRQPLAAPITCLALRLRRRERSRVGGELIPKCGMVAAEPAGPRLRRVLKNATLKQPVGPCLQVLP